MRDPRDDLDLAIQIIRAKQDCYPDYCEVYQALEQLRKDVEGIKESRR